VAALQRASFWPAPEASGRKGAASLAALSAGVIRVPRFKRQRPSAPPACAAPAPRTVTNTYTAGLFSAVGSPGHPGAYASAITYHPNLMVNQVVHANGMTDTYALDPNSNAPAGGALACARRLDGQRLRPARPDGTRPAGTC
jgi:hypothetical protein